MSAGVLLQAVLTGLSVGAIYGLVAMGFSLLAGLARVYALAHGDVVVASVLAAVLVVVGRTPVALDLGLLSSVVVVAIALTVGVGLSVSVFAVAMRPSVRRSDPVGWLAGAVAAGLLVRELLGIALPEQGYAVPEPVATRPAQRDRCDRTAGRGQPASAHAGGARDRTRGGASRGPRSGQESGGTRDPVGG